MATHFVSTVVRVTPHSTTASGNVRQEVTVEGGFSYVTAPDSHAGLVAQNLRPGDFVGVNLDDHDRITRIEVES